MVLHLVCHIVVTECPITPIVTNSWPAWPYMGHTPKSSFYAPENYVWVAINFRHLLNLRFLFLLLLVPISSVSINAQH